MRVIIAALLCLVSFSAQARVSPYPPITQFNGDRYVSHARMGADVARAVKAKTGAKHKHSRRHPIPIPRARPGTVRDYMPTVAYGNVEQTEAPMSIGAGIQREAIRVIGGRPSGCPRAFCGCGASIHLFGRIIPALNLAANWLRFPHAAPAPKMAAARHGHVFVLEQHVAGNQWLVYDANSGHGRTRMHVRSIAGFTVVNPHGSS